MQVVLAEPLDPHASKAVRALHEYRVPDRHDLADAQCIRARLPLDQPQMQKKTLNYVHLQSHLPPPSRYCQACCRASRQRCWVCYSPFPRFCRSCRRTVPTVLGLLPPPPPPRAAEPAVRPTSHAGVESNPRGCGTVDALRARADGPVAGHSPHARPLLPLPQGQAMYDTCSLSNPANLSISS
jgi:hypothetical protein